MALSAGLPKSAKCIQLHFDDRSHGSHCRCVVTLVPNFYVRAVRFGCTKLRSVRVCNGGIAYPNGGATFGGVLELLGVYGRGSN